MQLVNKLMSSGLIFSTTICSGVRFVFMNLFMALTPALTIGARPEQYVRADSYGVSLPLVVALGVA
jgi:hypothetical protein